MGKRLWIAATVLAVVLVFAGCGRKYPVIYAPDARIAVGESYDADDGVHALDSVDGDLTDQIRVTSGKLNVQKSGRYRIRYEVTNGRAMTTRASRVIVVSNQSASFWRTVIIVSVVSAVILALCLILWAVRIKRRRMPAQLCAQDCQEI